MATSAIRVGVRALDVGIDERLAAGLAGGALLLGASSRSIAIDLYLSIEVTNVNAYDADVPEVLFVCVHNAGRSQMAAALLDQRAGGRVTVRSAGSDPADQINPRVVEAMAELGIDVSPRAAEAADRRRGARPPTS